MGLRAADPPTKNGASGPRFRLCDDPISDWDLEFILEAKRKCPSAWVGDTRIPRATTRQV